MYMKPQHETGDFRLSINCLLDEKDYYPYGLCDIRAMIPVEVELNGVIGVVRSAIKRAKTGA